MKESLSGNTTGLCKKTENSVEGIYRVISSIIKDDALNSRIKKNCENYKYTPDKVYEQFMEMIMQ